MTLRTAIPSLCTFALVASLAATATAEETTGSWPGRVGGAGYLMPGVRQLNLGDLNDRLGEAGFSTHGQTFLSLGGGGHVMLGRLMLGGEGHGLVGVSGSSSRGNNDATVSGGYGLFRVGYAVVQTGGFSLYPMAGIGGGGLSLTVQDGDKTGFDAALSGTGHETRLTTGGLLLDAALGADYRIRFAGDDKEQGFVLVGLRGAYTFAPTGSDWQTSAGSAAGGPDATLAGPSVHLLIGLGGLGATF